MDPTIKKVKKKREGKKITVNVANPSFFTFFDPIRMPSDDELKKGNLIFKREDLERLDDKELKKLNGEVDDTDRSEKSDTLVEKTERGQLFHEEDLGERMDEDF